MWFLLRLTFWLGLVLVLLPRDKTPEFGQAAADRRFRSGAGCDRRGVRHEPVLQAPAHGLRSRRPGGDRDRPARGRRRTQGLRHHHRQGGKGREAGEGRQARETRCKPEKKAPGADKKAPDHTGSIGYCRGRRSGREREAPRETLTSDDLARGMASADAVSRFRLGTGSIFIAFDRLRPYIVGQCTTGRGPS